MAYWIRSSIEVKFFFSPVVGGVAVGGCTVRVGLRRMHGHVIFQHTTTTNLVVPVPSRGG